LGVNLKPLVTKTEVDLPRLAGKSVAIDAYNSLYQFLSIIRQANGTPLKDKIGRVTSHLSGLLYRTSRLAEMSIRVAYVFDGKPPSLKNREIKRRVKTRKEATRKYEAALARGETGEAFIYAQATSRLRDYMDQDSKQLLTLMGIPWIQAPGEGEAQAAFMTKRGSTDFCGSQDYDSLLFGAPRLVRNLTISGRRKLPRKQIYVDVLPEIIMLNKTLNELHISHKQMVDVGILVGTDYNPEGVKGVGPKKALDLIREHGELTDSLLESLVGNSPKFDFAQIRTIFLHPKVTSSYNLKWSKPDIEASIDFLCKERDFTEERVRRALGKLEKGIEESRSKTTLDTFF